MGFIIDEEVNYIPTIAQRMTVVKVCCYTFIILYVNWYVIFI